MTRHAVVVGVAVLFGAGGSALAGGGGGGGHGDGPDWIEGGDAGSDLAHAQITTGSGEIHRISGTLAGGLDTPDFEDMYLIRVLKPTEFLITGDTADFDPVLWIFNVTKAHQAFGLLANNNGPEGLMPVLTAHATDGTGAAITEPGVYAVAVSAFGRYPVSINGAIFTFASLTEVSGPDGPGGLNPHTGWAGPGGSGTYEVATEGIGFHSVPAPGSGVLLGLGAMLAGRRRRAH